MFRGLFYVKTCAIVNSTSIGIFDIINFPQLNDNAVRFNKKLGTTLSFIAKPNFRNINFMLNSYQIPHNTELLIK
jgi:hypothetical protein